MSKFAWLARLNADNAYQPLGIAKKDNGHCHQATIAEVIGMRFGGEICIGECIVGQQGTPLIGHPTAIALTETQSEVHASHGSWSIRGMQGEYALYLIIEKDRAELGFQFL